MSRPRPSPPHSPPPLPFEPPIAQLQEPNAEASRPQEALPPGALAGGSAYASVTLKQLVGMLSGIAADPPSWWTYHNLQGTIRSKREAAARDALASTPQATPGTAYVYSNWAYVVAGHLIEVTLNTTWEDALLTRLFQPLGIC